MAQLLISAAHKSSGKTTLTIGLCAALARLGLRVQPFKKGPDFIDPMWLSQASGHACFNLDPYLMEASQIRQLFDEHRTRADVSVVEGNKGLYDGLALDGSNSNAALAHLLKLPVVLVLDTRGMTRGIAPLLLGYQAFDSAINIAGVILNRVGGSRHESKLRAVIERYTDIPVLGSLGEDPTLAMTERHLGLIPSHEHAQSQQLIDRLGQRVGAQVNLEQLLQVCAAGAPSGQRSPPPSDSGQAVVGPQGVRIGIARDKAFCFYYEDDLLALKRAGAELVYFDTLNDAHLPQALDALFIGGGFPEMFTQELQANAPLRMAISRLIGHGLPTYAECGGLMYLSRSISWKGQRCEMVGAIEADVQLHDKPVGRGYVNLEATEHMPWAGLREYAIKAHEFHYSSLSGLAPDTRFAWRVSRGHGVDGTHDGIVQGRMLASYAHLRDIAGTQWTEHFVRYVQDCRAQDGQHALKAIARPEAHA